MTSIELDEYLELIRDFVDGGRATRELEERYITLFTSDQTSRDPRIFSILNEVFLDVDAYCADQSLRDKDDISEEELKARCTEALHKLKDFLKR